jgi:hypothetical protein
MKEFPKNIRLVNEKIKNVYNNEKNSEESKTMTRYQ